MGSLDVGEPTSTQTLTFGFAVRVKTNVRDDYLRRMIGDVVSDHLQAMFKAWSSSGAKDDPKRFVIFDVLIGPTVERSGYLWTTAHADYERIDDPYDMESSGRYEEPPKQRRPIE